MSSGCKGDCSCAKSDNKTLASVSDVEKEKNDTEDIWGDEDIEEIGKSNADIERMHTKQGYLDGLTNSQESSLQNGFDDLFPKGANLGLKVGQILAELNSTNKDLFEQGKNELNISNILDKKYFDDDLELKNEGDHDVLLKWEETLRTLQKQNQ